MKLIIISPFFPPSRIANSMRPARLAREMRVAGHSVEVVTRPPDASSDSVPIQALDASAGLVVHRIADPVPTWKVRWRQSRLINALIRRLWPDEHIFWMFRVARFLNNFDGKATVVAEILPVSTILLRLLVPSPRFNFVLDYQESVAAFRKMAPHAHGPHRQLSGLLERMERMALARVDRVVFTSCENRAAYISGAMCDENKSEYIPHFCDPNPYVMNDLPHSHILVISYVGYFNQYRTPETFLRGMRMFLDREPASASRIRVSCHGNGLGLHAHLATDLGLDGVVTDQGSLEYDEILRVLANSHILLLVTSQKHRLFFPSKLAEYMAARRPILALVPEDSEAATILRRNGRGDWLCGENDAGAVARCLSAAWGAFQTGALQHLLPPCEEADTKKHTPDWARILASETNKKDGE